MNREQMLEEALRRAIGLLSIAGSAATIDEMEELRAALSTPAEPRTVEPLTPDDVDLIAADGMRSATGGIYATQVYGFAEQIQRAAARKWGLVLAGGER